MQLHNSFLATFVEDFFLDDKGIMGNINSIDLSSRGSSENFDLHHKLQSVSLFNDAFVTSLSDKLPPLPEEDAIEMKESATVGENSEHLTRLKLLSKILARESQSLELENYPNLVSSRDKANSGFEVMRQRRMQVFLQVFKVAIIVLMFCLY